MEETKKMRYTDKEVALIKSTFKDNFNLLKVLRKLFLQVELDDTQKDLYGNLGKSEKALIRRLFLPVLDMEAPIYQVIDLMMTVQIKELDPEIAGLHLKARVQVIKYLEQQLKFIEGESGEAVFVFEDLEKIEGLSDDGIYIQILTRNTIIGHIEQQLGEIEILSNLKDETEDEIKERLEKDSSK